MVFVLQYATLGLGSEPGMIKREDHTRETTFNNIQGIVLITSKSVMLQGFVFFDLLSKKTLQKCSFG